MKKLMMLINTSAFVLILRAEGFPADLFGYPVVETQLRFYTLILGIIAVSVALVAFSCLCSRRMDARRAAPKSVERKVFGKFAAAAQSSK